MFFNHSQIAQGFLSSGSRDPLGLLKATCLRRPQLITGADYRMRLGPSPLIVDLS